MQPLTGSLDPILIRPAFKIKAVIFGLDPGLLGGLALHWTCSAMAQSTIAFVTASVAGKTIKTNSFAQVSAEETFDDLLERTLPGGIPGDSAVDIKIYKSSEDASFRREPVIDMNSGRTQKIIPVFALALGHVYVVFQVKPATAEPTQQEEGEIERNTMARLMGARTRRYNLQKYDGDSLDPTHSMFNCIVDVMVKNNWNFVSKADTQRYTETSNAHSGTGYCLVRALAACLRYLDGRVETFQKAHIGKDGKLPPLMVSIIASASADPGLSSSAKPRTPTSKCLDSSELRKHANDLHRKIIGPFAQLRLSGFIGPLRALCTALQLYANYLEKSAGNAADRRKSGDSRQPSDHLKMTVVETTSKSSVPKVYVSAPACTCM